MKIVGLILGGGAGTRLQPLTRERSKPAVPVAGKFRLVDIPISNCINSGIRNIFVLTQYNSVSLHQHIAATYRFDQFGGGFVRILAAEQTPESDGWFQGTADAVRRSIRYFEDDNPDLVVILSGDQLYRMDLNDVIKKHLEKKADLTVCTKPVGKNEASSLGIMKIDKDDQVKSFAEKPNENQLDNFKTMINEDERYLASMGIYIFKTSVLNDLLYSNPQTDFGKHIIPEAISKKKVFSYIFDDYWADIGTIKSFWSANLELTDPLPKFSFYDVERLIFTRMRYLPPSKINSCELYNSLISDGCILSGKLIKRSVIGLRAIVGEGSVIEESILMGADYYDNKDICKKGNISLGIGKNCIIKKAIIDKNVRIGDNVIITPENKSSNLISEKFCVQDGIIVIPKNTIIESNTVI